MNPLIAIIDYGMGNLFSVRMACHFVGLRVIVTHDKDALMKADGVILPGVGAFPRAMEALSELKLIEVIPELVFSNKPVMGICLGMQLLMTASEEFGLHKGIGIVPGKVIRFSSIHGGDKTIVKVPHIGWTPIRIAGAPCSLLANLRNDEPMYFVHSYFVVPSDRSMWTSSSSYGGTTFCSSLQMGNLFACQFHPERSGPAGIQVYRNFRAHVAGSATIPEHP